MQICLKSDWANILPKKITYLTSVTCAMLTHSPTNNFAQENNWQFCLDLSWPTLHKEITCAILAHGWQPIFMRKMTYTMLCQPYLGKHGIKILSTKLSKYIWDNTTCAHVSPEQTGISLEWELPNNLFLFCLMLVLEFMYGLWDNSE